MHLPDAIPYYRPAGQALQYENVRSLLTKTYLVVAKAVVNRYCQSHELPNLFVTSGAVFPTYFGYNPTHTIEAISFWAADYIKTQSKSGGALAGYF